MFVISPSRNLYKCKHRCLCILFTFIFVVILFVCLLIYHFFMLVFVVVFLFIILRLSDVKAKLQHLLFLKRPAVLICLTFILPCKALHDIFMIHKYPDIFFTIFLIFSIFLSPFVCFYCYCCCHR